MRVDSDRCVVRSRFGFRSGSSVGGGRSLSADENDVADQGDENETPPLDCVEQMGSKPYICRWGQFEVWAGRRSLFYEIPVSDVDRIGKCFGVPSRVNDIHLAGRSWSVSCFLGGAKPNFDVDASGWGRHVGCWGVGARERERHETAVHQKCSPGVELHRREDCKAGPTVGVSFEQLGICKIPSRGRHPAVLGSTRKLIRIWHDRCQRLDGLSLGRIDRGVERRSRLMTMPLPDPEPPEQDAQDQGEGQQA